MATEDTDLAAVQRRTIRTLSFALVAGGIGGTVPAGGLIAVVITGSEAAASWAQTLTILGAAAAALPLARIVLAHGRRIALTSALTVSAVGTLLILAGSQMHNVFLVYLGSAVFGVVSAAIYQGRYTATDLAPEHHRARALSWVVWAGTIGAVLGPNLLYLSDTLGRSLGLPEMSGPYVVSTVALLIGAGIIFVRLRPDPYLLATRNITLELGTARQHQLRRALGHLHGRPRAVLGIVSVATATTVLVMITVTMPARMLKSGVSLQIIGLVVSVNIAGMYLFSPLVGWAVDRIGRIPMITVGAGVLSIACILSGVTSEKSAVIVALAQFLLGLGWSCTMIAGSTLLTDEVSPIDRPVVQGFSDVIVNISSAVGGLVAGVLIALTSFMVLSSVALLPLICLGVILTLPASRRHSTFPTW